MIGKLNCLLSFPASQGNLDDILYRLEGLAAGFLGAVDCTVVLFADDEHEKSCIQASRAFGRSTPETSEDSSARPGRASGTATATGALVFTERERPQHVGDVSKRSMNCPIVSHGKTIGLIHVGKPQTKRYFTTRDLRLLEVVALVIARTVHVIQLQNILSSRFAQIALAQRVSSATVEPLTIPLRYQSRIAPIIAKSFYREMKNAGFGPNQIITTASEILSELSTQLRRNVG